MAHREIGMTLLKRLEKDLSTLAEVEQFPKNGRSANGYGDVGFEKEIVVGAAYSGL